MHKFFDYLAPDLPVKTIGELAGYIRRFAALFSGGVPVEGHMGGVAFCATEQPGGGVRVHRYPIQGTRNRCRSRLLSELRTSVFHAAALKACCRRRARM